jgi:Arylsulfotransferase (ASST)
VSYHSAPQLGAQRLCVNRGVRTHGTAPGTYLFVTPGGIDSRGGGAGIFQDDGTLVWWQPFREQYDLTVVHYRGHPYLAVWRGKPDFTDPYGNGRFVLYNEHYQRVGSITTGARVGRGHVDPHEFRITPQGDALFGIYQPVGVTYHGRRIEVYQYVVQEVSLVRGSGRIQAGRVLFQWKSLQHVPLSQSRLPAPTDHTVWDYFHGNAISQDADGNLLVSARNTWGIYKINIHTGRTIWEIGARGERTLAEPWCYQHDIEPLGHGLYSLFDDGGQGPGCQGINQHAARGLIIRVDPSQQPAAIAQVRAYSRAPVARPGCCGNMQALTGGASLIDWGSLPSLTQYAPGGGVEMSLSMSAWSYRAYRFPWKGLPLTRPAVAARFGIERTRVWVSWNGSTEVRAWRVLAGSGRSHLTRTGSAQPKRAFETEIVLPRPCSRVAVQALGASGEVLATSRTVRAG